MALFRPERGIGRGEVAESRLEVPVFALFIVLCSLVLTALHLQLGNDSITVAAAVSMFVFGVTVVRVDFGVYILVIAMMLSPEIETGNELTGERSLNIRYDDILIMVIFLGVMVKLGFEGRLSLWAPSPVNGGIAAYYTVCIISTLLALEHNLPAWDRRAAFFIMLKMLEFYLVFFLVGQALRNSDEVRRQLVVFFIVALIVSFYGIYTIGTTPRVSAPLEKGGTEPNTLGGYLTLVIAMAMALFTQAPKWRAKLALLAISGIAFVPLLYTLSRASYASLFVAISCVGLVSRRMWILGVLALTMAFSPLVMPEKVIKRVAYTFQVESGQKLTVGDRELGLSVDKSTEERILVWRKVRFILGIGGIYALFGGGVSWESVLDSQYARVILETGLVGLAAFIFMQFTILRTARQSYRWSGDWVGRGLGMGVFCATIALIVHSVGTISFLIVRIMEPFWFLTAMCVIVRNQAIEQHWARYRQQIAAQQAPPSQDKPPKPSPKPSPPSAKRPAPSSA